MVVSRSGMGAPYKACREKNAGIDPPIPRGAWRHVTSGADRGRLRPMSDTDTPTGPGAGQRFRERQRVEAARDIDGVPEGTQGTVLLVTGLSWIRYRVRFDNGIELNLLDGADLAPVSKKG